MSKTSLFCHFWELKNHPIHKHSNTCHAFNFHRKLIFFDMLVTMSSIRINNNWNYQNLLITSVRSPGIAFLALGEPVFESITRQRAVSIFVYMRPLNVVLSTLVVQRRETVMKARIAVSNIDRLVGVITQTAF